MVAQQSGTTRKRIARKKLSALTLPVPSLPEQRRIVDLLEDHLSRLDAATAGLESASRRLAVFGRESVQRAVTAGTTTEVALGSLIERVEAGKSFGGSAPPATNDDWGVIKVSAMTWGEFRHQENKAVPAALVNQAYEIAPGDILVSRANTTAYVGAPVLVRSTPRRRLLSDKSLRLIPRNEVNREWLVAVLSAPNTRRQISAIATGTSDSMRNVSQKNLLSVRVPLASPEEQRSIVRRLADVRVGADRLAYELNRGRARADVLRRAVLEAAFSGRLTGRSADAEVVGELAEVAP
ncbi:restriction endonuclease subunit S [Blastococcus saxobsidens]|uniref:restriction endonuclease subunit S n=1 Tax=Blastococcus saxobsidens TaxID=138336 RepID=UPI00140FDE44|nr:restriction endonuclease subunit S [Blastococcus saxobsidens]